MKLRRVVFGAAWVFASGVSLAASGNPPNGEWKGEMQCGATLSGNSEAFANPVTMITFDGKARVTRETPQVVENLSGMVSESGHVDASGPGQFKSGQGRPWNTSISGQITGTRFEGIGGIYDMGGKKRRDCRVSLSLMAGSQPAASSEKPVPGKDVKAQRPKSPSASQETTKAVVLASPQDSAQSTVPAKPAPTLASIVNAFAIPAGANYSANTWDITDSIPGVQWEHKGLRETPRVPFSRLGHVKLDKLAVVTVFFGGVRAMVSEMNVSITNNDAAVIEKSDFLKLLHAQFGASSHIRQLRGGCKNEGQISGSAVYEITLRGKKPVYLLMETDSSGSAPNSRSTTLQFELEPQRRWVCTA
ncbi:MAG: hypothetical protein V4468_16940 [Pseudomonadota bacterium]